jgi:hypothetical protein
MAARNKCKQKEDGCKISCRTFLQGQSADLFRAAIESQATRDPYQRRLIGFLKRMGEDLQMHLLNLQKVTPQLLKIK